MFRQQMNQEERNNCISYLQEEMKLLAFREIEERRCDEIFIQYHSNNSNITKQQLNAAF